LGDGDLYLAALLGAWLGWSGALTAIFLSYFVAAAILSVLLILRKVKAGQYVPFGPALAAGGLITLFCGPQLIAWYVGRFWL
jgi:prepilin signal peptidase PulO-like enzyme (type II secretory pathway)